MTRLEPLPRARRHPADYRDEQEHEAVAEVLSCLPAEHPAVMLYCAGDLGAADTIKLTHLVGLERPDLIKRLMDAYWAASRRIGLGHGSVTCVTGRYL